MNEDFYTQYLNSEMNSLQGKRVAEMEDYIKGKKAPFKDLKLEINVKAEDRRDDLYALEDWKADKEE